MLEERSLRADEEDRFIVAVRLHLAKVGDEFQGLGPTETSGKFARQEIGVQQIEIMTEVSAHASSIAAAKLWGCIALLTAH